MMILSSQLRLWILHVKHTNLLWEPVTCVESSSHVAKESRSILYASIEMQGGGVANLI